MKDLISILNRFEHRIEHAEEILVEEHALNIAPSINKMFYELAKTDRDIAVAIEHLHNSNDIKGKNSLTEIIRIALLPYENRTIHIERKPCYSELAGMLESYRGVNFVAAYRHYFFEPMSIDMWEKHHPMPDTRMVFYARDAKNKDQKRAVEAVEKAAGMLGSLATTKRKRYNQYASRAYTINDRNGLHARPAAELVTTANKYAGDAWIRTDNMEINAKSIMHVLMLAATADKKLTILYKPKENSEGFYSAIEGCGKRGRILSRAD